MVLIVIEHASQRKSRLNRFTVSGWARALCRAGTWSLRGSGRALGGAQFRSYGVKILVTAFCVFAFSEHKNTKCWRLVVLVKISCLRSTAKDLKIEQKFSFFDCRRRRVSHDPRRRPASPRAPFGSPRGPAP